MTGMKSEIDLPHQILRNHPLDVAKMSVGTYSPSKAVTPDLGEELNRVNHKI